MAETVLPGCISIYGYIRRFRYSENVHGIIEIRFEIGGVENDKNSLLLRYLILFIFTDTLSGELLYGFSRSGRTILELKMKASLWRRLCLCFAICHLNKYLR